MQRSTYWIGFFLIGFFFFKVIRFQTLGYTFNDMYAFLQMSRSWMDGRPFMYENIWGYHHRIHNYYTVLLWGPLCQAFGAYGLFAVETFLLLISYALVNEQLSKRGVPGWARYLFLCVILLGPVSFWLNDHPNIGWHTELTYLPVSLLFALALLGRNRLLSVLAGSAIVLVKEDGAVLAALIHLAFEGIRYVRQQPDRPLINWLLQRKFWFIAIGWGAIFLGGMFWVSYKNNFAEPRLKTALTLLSTNAGKFVFWKQMLGMIGMSLLLLLPVVGVLLFVLRHMNPFSITRVFSFWLIGIVVLTALNLVQSVLYFGQPLFYLVALTWPPRFILVWSFSAAFLLLQLTLPANQFNTVQVERIWLIGAGLIISQAIIVYLARPDLPSLRDWYYTFRGRYASDKNRAYLQPEDIAVVKCLAENIPLTANVFAFDYLVPFFHRHYGIWPTGNQYQPADLAILPIGRPNELHTVVPMRRPYRVIPLKGYTIYVSAEQEQVVRQCLR